MRHVTIFVFSLASLLITGAARADTITAANNGAADQRFFSAEGDWDPGRLKAECADGDMVVGISGTASTVTAGVNGISAACRHTPTVTWSRALVFATHGFSGGDRGDFNVGDWDVGFNKAECGQQEVVAGFSQTAGSRMVTKILCRQSCAAASNEASCNTVVYNQVTNRLSQMGGDWAFTFLKNQCGDNQLLKGVSRSGDGSIHALLCCDMTTAVPCRL